MKKFFSFVAFMALTAVMLCSCSDSTPAPTPAPTPDPAPAESGADYLVMIYGVGGKTLDRNIVANMMQVLDVGSDEKVKVTFQFKLSKDLQTDPALRDFDGTRRFTADDNAHLKGQFQSLTSDYPSIPKGELDKSTSQLKTERFADAAYDMSCSEGLTDFIKWSKEKYPNAKHTVLVITDHGNGWNFVYDGQKDTRSILSDDNVGRKLSLNDVANGVNGGGGVDLLYADACLMSTYENLYGYAQCAKYLIASYEVAPGIGGDYRELMKLLKAAGSKDADLVAAAKAFVDYTVSDEWWNKYSVRCRDMAFYDLSRLDEVTPVLKNIAGTLAEKFVSEESIEPTAETLYGDRFAPYIRRAVLGCVVSDAEMTVYYKNIPWVIVEAMLDDGVKLYDEEFDLDDLVLWIRYAPTERAKETFENYPEEWAFTRQLIAIQNETAYSLTDLLRILDKELTDIGAKNPFKPLRSELLAALRSIGHIGCTYELDPDLLDTAYELCSPGLILLPLNELFNNQETNYFATKIPDYQDALRYYENTAFDRQVQWSRFLKVLDVTPTAFTNTMRQNFGAREPKAEARRP